MPQQTTGYGQSAVSSFFNVDVDVGVVVVVEGCTILLSCCSCCGCWFLVFMVAYIGVVLVVGVGVIVEVTRGYSQNMPRQTTGYGQSAVSSFFLSFTIVVVS